MDTQLQIIGLGYTILAGLVGLAFFLGRQSSRLDQLSTDQVLLHSTLTAIYGKLDVLADAAATNRAWHDRQASNDK